MLYSYIPAGFRYNYIVPIPKLNECHRKSLIRNDFRAVSIRPILSKIFVHCIIDRFSSFFETTDNQLGFKKGVGFSYAIQAVRNIVDSYIHGCSTSNMSAIDLSKSLDKVNHHALFLKLLTGFIPN